jgi:hypothetical protein
MVAQISPKHSDSHAVFLGGQRALGRRIVKETDDEPANFLAIVGQKSVGAFGVHARTHLHERIEILMLRRPDSHGSPLYPPIITVGQQMEIIPPCIVGSPRRAACMLPM